MIESEYVRHRARPQWGPGKVIQQTSDKVHVQFAHGLVMLDVKIAGPLLEPVSAEEAAASLSRAPRAPRTLRTSRTSRTSRPAPAHTVLTAYAGPISEPIRPDHRNRRCINCADRLGDLMEVATADGTWRACPSCSARDEREHILLPYPSGFYAEDEARDAEASTAIDCLACRTGGERGRFQRCRQATKA